MHVVQTVVCTSVWGLPQGLALLFQPVAMVQPLGFQASQTNVQKFLAVRKNSGEPKDDRRSALTFSLLNFIFRRPSGRARNAN